MGLLAKWKLGNDTNERFYFIFSNTIVLPAHYWTQHGFMSMQHFDIFTWQRKLQVFVNGLQSFMLTYLGMDIATVSVGPKDYSCVRKLPWGWNNEDQNEWSWNYVKILLSFCMYDGVAVIGIGDWKMAWERRRWLWGGSGHKQLWEYFKRLNTVLYPNINTI